MGSWQLPQDIEPGISSFGADHSRISVENGNNFTTEKIVGKRMLRQLKAKEGLI
jgi:hypothetical protein